MHAMTDNISYRPPEVKDGAAIWELVKSTGVLDVNSLYAYLMIAANFRATSAVAEQDGRLAGFLSAYRLPDAPHTLFVWQIGVSGDFQGRGVASGLLHHVITRPELRDIRFIDTTISPSNTASQKLFRRLAKHLKSPILTHPFLTVSDFGGTAHEDEVLYRIGPISFQSKETL